jgi:hypothetical protein
MEHSNMDFYILDLGSFSVALLHRLSYQFSETTDNDRFCIPALLQIFVATCQSGYISAL